MPTAASAPKTAVKQITPTGLRRKRDWKTGMASDTYLSLDAELFMSMEREFCWAVYISLAAGTSWQYSLCHGSFDSQRV